MNSALEALLNDDPTGFKETVESILMDKLSDRIEVERANAASSMFEENGPEYEEDEFNDEDDEYED